MAVEVHVTTDASEAIARAGAFLRTDPVRNNVICTLLDARAASGTPIRFWWATTDGEVAGAVFQSPSTFPALLSNVREEIAAALARAVVDIPGIGGPAAAAASFAGEHATATRRPARPLEGQRLYEIERVTMPAGVAGIRRLATEQDQDVVTAWVAGFGRDTGLASREPSDPAAEARRVIASGRLHLWEIDGQPRCCTVAQHPAHGVVRVGFVYTPPEQRGNGFASALVAEVSDEVLAGGERCILYTQLENPTSNAIYQRLGYRPVAEVLRYDFD